MKAWRLSLTNSDNEHSGYVYFNKKSDMIYNAKHYEKKGYEVDVEEIIISITADGIIEALDKYGGHRRG